MKIEVKLALGRITVNGVSTWIDLLETKEIKKWLNIKEIFPSLSIPRQIFIVGNNGVSCFFEDIPFDFQNVKEATETIKQELISLKKYMELLETCEFELED